MNKREKENQFRMFETLRELGMSYDDITALRRISMTLHRWHELECGDSDNFKSWSVERDGEEPDSKPFMVYHIHQGEYGFKVHYREDDNSDGSKGDYRASTKTFSSKEKAAEYAATIVDSTAALRVDGKAAEALVNRGVALMLQGRPSYAVVDISKGLALAPSHAERAYFNRAMAREDMGDLRGAYLDYREAAKMDPSWDRPKKELARFTVVQHTPTS